MTCAVVFESTYSDFLQEGITSYLPKSLYIIFYELRYKYLILMY